MSLLRPWKLVSAGIIIFWIIMMGIFIRREVILPIAPQGNFNYKRLIKEGLPLRQHWLGIYYQSEKVGFSTTAMDFYREKDFTGYAVRNHTFLRLTLLCRQNEVDLRAFLVLNNNFKLHEFNFNLKSGPHIMDFKGVVAGRRLDMEILSGGKKIQRSIEAGDEFLLSNTMTPFLILPQLEPGITYAVNILDPLTLGTGEAHIKIDKDKGFRFRGRAWDAYKVEVEYKGINTTSWVTEEGDVLRQETPLGWILEMESPQEAVRLPFSGTSPELLKALAVPSNVIIPNPRETRYLKIKLEGVDSDRFSIENARQKIIAPADSERVIEIFAEGTEQAAQDDSVNNLLLLNALKSTAFIQSDDENIMRQSDEITGKLQDNWEKAKGIGNWVYEAIDKVPSITIPSAVEVLYSMQGDCNEHATLYTALARAAKIPTQTCIGVVYHEGAFYYHAWVKVFVGKWVSMDPTFGQDIADATHIELISGELDKQVEIAALIGKLKITVLEYR
ncbi:MAG: transglutaminase domain-containing protein [Candidatus Omnitrophica bacterium]|nr:transglutaminase domain-containing protein [Candidatus Omnitrophota bacterium]